MQTREICVGGAGTLLSLTNTSSLDPPFDPVTGNVAACSEYAEAYEVAHAMKMSHTVARMAY
jgi:hypothetical protein